MTETPTFLLRTRRGTVLIVDSFVDDFGRRVLITAGGEHLVRTREGLETWKAHQP